MSIIVGNADRLLIGVRRMTDRAVMLSIKPEKGGNADEMPNIKSKE